MKKVSMAVFALFLPLLMLFTGCGGGGGAGGNTVSGVAAAGAPLVGTVYLKDSSIPAKELSGTINANGSYSFNVDGLKPPFILKAQGAAGGTNQTFYSFSPAVGIANINPLSHLSVVLANSGIDPASIYANPILKLSLISTALPNVLNDIQTKLNLLLSYFGASTINFIYDSFTANHHGLDQLFDLISITISNGTVTIANKTTGGVIFSSPLNTSTLTGLVNLNNVPNRFSIQDNWQLRASGTNNHLYSVTYGNGTFVAVGDLGTILTSSDGTSWQPCASGITTSINSVIYANGIFVAVGGNGKILTSTNGTAWQLRNSGITTGIGGITYGNGIFVALTSYGTITSANGATWSVYNTLSPTNYYNGIAYGNGVFVVVDINSIIFTSTNGTTWQSNNLSAGTQLQAITYGNGTFVAVGAGGILTSTTGTAWQDRGVSNVGQINGITYCNGAFITVGRMILISDANGINWWKMNYEQQAGTSNMLESVAYGKGTLVAVGLNGTILQLVP